MPVFLSETSCIFSKKFGCDPIAPATRTGTKINMAVHTWWSTRSVNENNATESIAAAKSRPRVKPKTSETARALVGRNRAVATAPNSPVIEAQKLVGITSVVANNQRQIETRTLSHCNCQQIAKLVLSPINRKAPGHMRKNGRCPGTPVGSEEKSSKRADAT